MLRDHPGQVATDISGETEVPGGQLTSWPGGKGGPGAPSRLSCLVPTAAVQWRQHSVSLRPSLPLGLHHPLVWDAGQGTESFRFGFFI